MKKNSSKLVKNEKSVSKTCEKLIKYCKKYIFLIILAIIFSAGSTVFIILGPDKLGDMTQELQNGLFGLIDMQAVKKIALTLILFYSTSVILSYLQGYIMAIITQKVTQKMRGDISKKINRLPLKYFDTTSHGDIISRVTNDVDTIGQTLNQSIGNLVSAIVLFLGSTIMMFITSWMMALIAIGASLIGFMLMFLIISKSQKYFIKQQRLLGDLNV